MKSNGARESQYLISQRETQAAFPVAERIRIFCGALTTGPLAGQLEIVVHTLMGLVMLTSPFVAIAGARVAMQSTTRDRRH